MKAVILAPLQENWIPLGIASSITLAASLLRVYKIGEQELWHDEAFSFHLATMVTGFGHNLLIENSPPLYYLLLRAWVTVAGTSEAALRLPSALFGTIFVIVVMWAGWQFFNARVGLWSGGFAAISPIHIYYSQEAKVYALLVLLLLVTYVLLWRALTHSTLTAWVLVSLSVLLALYSHYCAILGLLPTVFLVWLWPEDSQTRQRWLAYRRSVFWCGFLFVPWVFWSFVLTSHPTALVPFLPDSSQPRPWATFVEPLEVLGLGGQAGLSRQFPKVFHSLVFPESLRMLGVATLLLMGIWVAIPLLDRRLAVPWLGKRKAWLWSLLIVPVGTLTVILAVKPLTTYVRYYMIAFPAYALLIGLAMAKLQSARKIGPALTTVAALGLLIPIGAKLLLYYGTPPPTHDQTLHARASAKALHVLTNNDDVVVFTDRRGVGVLYYLHRLGYRWEDGYCRNSQGDRYFSCNMFPPEDGQYVGLVQHTESINATVRGYLEKLNRPGASLWILFGNLVIQHQRVFGNSRAAALADELSQLGLSPVLLPNDVAPGIFRFASPEIISGSAHSRGP